MKKISLCLTISNLLLISSFTISNVHASEKSNIPDYMAPNTIIEYINDEDYKIVQGGEYIGTPIYDNSFIQKCKSKCKCF